ncbi:PAS domain S-box protein [Halobellus marinus]|uniref:PAS domain S-box protein n=1 Tax=Halobellus TaxID=1073986 RepID=UPI0028A7B4C2|nr:PAS domain S-box protein [Halobellus sp. DFY28]
MGPTEDISDETGHRSPLPEEVVREIYHSVNDAIFLHSAETGEILDVNETMCEMYGYSRAEARQLSIEDLSTGVPPYTQDTAREYLQKAAEGDPQIFDWHAKDSEGAPFWVEVSMRRATFEDQTFVLAIVRNITDRKRREHELKELFEEYEAIFENAQDAIFLINVDNGESDPVFRFGRLSPSHESKSGLLTENVRGKTPREVLGDEIGAEVEANYRRCVYARETITYEEELPMSDRQIVWQTKLAPVIVDDKVNRIVGIARDITDRKALEADLKRSLNQLKVMDRVLRHNLHNEINVIKGNAETIRRISEDDVAEMAEIIIEESERLLTTAEKEREITDVLVDEQSPEPIDLDAVIDAAVTATRKQYPEAHITVEGTVDRQVGAIGSINRALTELLSNAVDHSDQTEPSIEVTIENRDDVVAIRIADNGPGIPEMERQIITEEAEIEPMYHGSGLGLWLVKTIVENSGGSLAFDKNQPRGSIVTITLPVAPVSGTD